MTGRNSLTGWYLVYTKPHNEIVANTNLQRQGFTTFLPFYQCHKRRRNLYQMVTEPLFPRYIFVHLTENMSNWSTIRSTRGCISLVTFGASPARVPENLIARLIETEKDQKMTAIDYLPDFKLGDKVRIVDGIISNYEGIIASKTSRERVTLLLSLAEGHTRTINVSVHQIELTG